MTAKVKQHNGFDHSTAIKDAELELSVAAGRIITADQAAADAKVIRDQLITELQSGNDEVSATELAAADAAVRRGDALAVGARHRHQTAEQTLVAAVLAATQAAAGRLAVTAPAALAELKAARTTAATANARVTELENLYIGKARKMGEALRIAGAPRLAAGDPGTGWCGRDGATGSVLGFNVDGLAVVDYVLATTG